ncbi:MAG: prolipoprotein diacylglyceryl transferase [Anaerolineae bacterium]|nr:prolipoprotein diacylglyceryl transferase [Anaerolineae bacterium]
MLPTLDLGPVALPTAGLVYILGIWLALTVVERSAARLALNVPVTYNLAALGLAVGVIAARLAFVARYWDAYRQNLVGIVWPLTSGFSLLPGLIAGLAAAFFYARAKRLPAWPTLDALVPALLVALLAISLADFLAGPGFGERADLLWSIDLFGVRRHPVQIYEIVVGLVALLAWRRAVHSQRLPGQAALMALAVYSAGRLFVDAYRANVSLTADGYHVVQIASLGILLASLGLLARRATTAD